MKPFATLTTTIVLGALTLSAPAQAAGINWATDLNSARQTALRINKPLLVTFYATWCPSCKVLDEQSFRDGRFIQQSRKFVMLRLDTDREGDAWGDQLGISSVPTMAAFTPSGREMGRISGAYSGPALAQALRDLTTHYARLPEARQHAERLRTGGTQTKKGNTAPKPASVATPKPTTPTVTIY